MQYNKIIDQSITYIKDHINEELSAEKIANQVGYSTFHFCRIFSLVKG
ncbi:AraC family transcriptional regulator, partial [Clostridium perfringens]